MARTAGNMLSRVRNHIEEPTAGYWSDSELYAIISAKQDDLWGKIISLRDTYFLNTTPATISVVSGTTKYNLPSDFYKVKTLRCTTTGNENTTFRWTRMTDPEFLNGLRSDIVVSSPSDVLYDILGPGQSATAQIQFSPTPQSNYSVSLEYIVQPTEVTASGDYFLIPDAFLQFIEYAATGEALAKGPVGDPNYWENKADKEWFKIAQIIGAPRQDSGPDVVEGMFSRY